MWLNNSLEGEMLFARKKIGKKLKIGNFFNGILNFKK